MQTVSPLVILIDPDDNDPQQLMDHLLQYHAAHPDAHRFDVWAGCSNSPGADALRIVEYLREGGMPCSVYPGNPEQVKETCAVAAHYYLPDPLLHENPTLIEGMKKQTLAYLAKAPASAYSVMTYILVNPNCSTARVFKLDSYSLDDPLFGDESVIAKLKENQEKHELDPGSIVYLEGGSRVKAGGIVSRVDLARKIKQVDPTLHLLGAGGITSIEDMQYLLQQRCLDTILISGALHKTPTALPGYVDAFWSGYHG